MPRWTELRRRVVVGEVRAVVAGGARGEGRCRGCSGGQRAWGSSRRRGGADAQLGRALVRRSDGNTAAQRSGVAERGEGDALGFGRLRQGEMVGAEGHRGHFKKARASWAGVPRKEISRGIQAGLTRPLRERDPEEGDGADQRGHGVSGRSAGDALGRAGLTGWASTRHGPSGRRRAGWAAREGREQAEPGRGERVGRTA